MLNLWEMSLSGGVLIAAIVVVRSLAAHRLPRRTFPILWAVALCRLLLPLSLPSPVSVYSAAAPLGLLPRRAGVLLNGSGEAAAGAALPALSPLAAAWAAGLVLLGVGFLAAHLRSRREYGMSLPVEHPFVKTWLATHRLRRPIQVRRSDLIDSPLTYGVLRPVILLPKALDWEDEEQLSYVLSHEFFHIRRFDALTKWLLAAAVCVHWFNPLVYVMYILANRDLELSCDAAVVSACGLQARGGYARTLVGLEARRTRFAPLASAFNRSAMEERIVAIMKAHRTTLAGTVGALVLVVLVASVFATSAPHSTGAGTPPGQGTAQSSAVGSSGSRTVVAGGFGAIQKAVVSQIEDASGYPSNYTREQYDLVMNTLKLAGYESMSIAEFNRRINALFSEDDWEKDGLNYAYEAVLSTLPDDDPNAPFLRNTVQASRTEYGARLDEVYSGKQVDPDFSGAAMTYREEDIFGDKVRTDFIRSDYEFTYRILNQDALTVAARDAFLQAVMQGAQDYLNANPDTGADEEVSFRAALEEAGKSASNDFITFTGCTVWNYETD